MKKIAVLGANGFLGKPICDRFEQLGLEVFRLSRQELPGMQRVDLFDELSIRKFLTEIEPNFVISTAWETEHGKFWEKPTNNNYYSASIKFAELCFNSGVEIFVGLGTMTEYGHSPGKCNSLNSPLNPEDLYSRKKVEMGLALQELATAYNKEFRWMRIFQAFGENEKKERFVPSLISSLRCNKRFEIQTPNNTLDWIHSQDVASAIAYSTLNSIGNFLDIGSGVGISVHDFAQLLCRFLHLDYSLLNVLDQNADAVSIYVDPGSQLLRAGWTVEKSLRARIESLDSVTL